MAIGQIGTFRRILLALVVGFGPTTTSVAATVDAPDTVFPGVPFAWQQNLSGGMGLASLAMEFQDRHILRPLVAQLPVTASQLTFSLSPVWGPVFSYVRNGRVVSSTTPMQWRKNYVRQSFEVTSFNLPGKPWSLQLHVGETGALHLSVSFRDSRLNQVSLLRVSAVSQLQAAAPPPANVPLSATIWQAVAGMLLLVLTRSKRRRVPGG